MRILRFFIKIFIAIFTFLLIFWLIQPFFIPKYIKENAETTSIVTGYSYTEANSIDVVFLGASQTYCSFDTIWLYEKYHISSYNYAGSAQPISLTSFFFDEAIKTQSPKLVVVEVCNIFLRNDELKPINISNTYAPTPFSTEKVHSLAKTFEGDMVKIFEHSVAPLLVYHERWRILGESEDLQGKYDFDYVFHPENYSNVFPRGFVSHESISKQKLEFSVSDTTLKNIPEESKDAIKHIADICKEKNFQLLLVKAPVPNWTRGDSESVNNYAKELNVDFIDLNIVLEEISIDENTDFYNEKHLNASGAKKTTDYFAKILNKYLMQTE